MKKKNIYILIAVVLVVTIGIVYATNQSDRGESSEVLTTASFGDFVIDIATSGELEAKNSVRIQGPPGLQRAQIWQVKIDDIVDEGTRVEKGDYIARLDQTELMDKIQQARNDLQQSDSKYTQTRLDTAMELRKARDELINLKYDIDEKKIALDQSEFEPPAVKQQAVIDHDKAERAHKQAVDGYELKKEKAVAQMAEAAAERSDDQIKVNFLTNLQEGFNILAPESGMLIYHRSWNGTKKGVGSTVQAWNPIVATLPDLSRMVSRTYVSEVDIRIIKTGQEVVIGLDAFPNKKLTGKVVQVANVGEQKPNSDSKVFQVDVEINESDTTLRPGMTTSNTIIAEIVPQVVYVPLEALHSQGDSITYVLKKDGMGYIKQEVEVGQSNLDEVIILKGISEGDLLYLSDPDGFEAKSVRRLMASTGSSN